MTFASGFAQGYIDAKTRKEDRQNELDDQTFKYSMDALVQQRTLRMQKAVQEQQYGRTAQILATQAGMPDAAGTIHDMLSAQIPVDQVNDSIAKGLLVKNPNYVAPTQTVDVPQAPTVAPADPSVATPAPDVPLGAKIDTAPVGSTIPNTPNTTATGPTSGPGIPNAGSHIPTPMPSPNDSSNPYQVAASTGVASTGSKGMTGKTTAPVVSSSGIDPTTAPFNTGNARVNARIDAIDPSLRGNHDPIYSAPLDPNGAYILKPKSAIQISDLPTSIANLEQARLDNDPIAIRKWDMQVRANRMSMTIKSDMDAQAAGKSGAQKYVLRNPDGSIKPGGIVSGKLSEDGKTMMNITDPTNPVPMSGDVRLMPDDIYKRYNDLQDSWQQKSLESQDRARYTAAAFNSGNIMTQILKNNPTATTSFTGGTLEFLNNLKGEAGAAWSTLQDVEKNINKESAAGDYSNAEKYANAHAEAFSKFYNATIGTSGNERTAVDAALYRSARMDMVQNLAASQGMVGRGQSDQDIKNTFTQIGGIDARSNVAQETIKQALATALGKANADRLQLTRGPIATFENDTGIKTGMAGVPVEDLLAQFHGTPEEQKQLSEYFKSVQQPMDYGQALAARTAAESSGQTPSVVDTQVNAVGAKNAAKATILPGASGQFEYVGPLPMTEKDRTNKANWKEQK